MRARCVALVVGTLQALAVASALAQATRVPAIEYYHAEWGHYFVTTNPDEISKLDDGRFAGWTRTGYQFNVYAIDAAPAGSQQVCRFFSDQAFAPVSSHFYTPSAAECAGVLKNPSWLFEGRVFSVTAPTIVDNDGACPVGSTKVYRMYNNGMGGAPNHRYMTDVTVTDAMFAQGWCDEGYGSPPPGPNGQCSASHHPGVIFCAPT